MTIVHIADPYGTTNVGGAAGSAVRLHLAMLAHGVDSHFICVSNRVRNGRGLNVHELPRGLWRILYMRLVKLSRGIWRCTKYRRSLYLNVVPMFGLGATLKKIKPDIIHIHAINGDICTYEQLAKLPYKFVFNLHDLSMLCGFDVHPGDDPRFVDGYDKSNSPRIESWLFGRKCRLIEKVKPTFVADSKWVESMCRRSYIGRHYPVRTIYDLADSRFFSLAHTSANSQTFTSACPRAFKLLFGCFGGLTNRFKGFPDLLKAFEFLSPEERERIVLEVFGSKNLAETESRKCEKLGIRMVNLGIPSNEDLLRYYRSADLFVFPSVKETIGMTKVEALLCGTPVVAFDRTACAEGIIHGETGWVATDGDFQAFAEGIRYYLMHPIDRVAIAAKTAKLFSADRILTEELDLYRMILNGQLK